MRIRYLAAAAALCLALPATAQTIKPGLWEINNKMSGGQMDQAMSEMQKAMAGMSPAERKQMEEMMARQGVKMVAPGAGGGMAVQVCMTKEQVERNDMPMQDGCRMTQNTRSGNTLRMAYTCTRPPSSGEGTVTFHSSESYTSKMTVKSTEQGRTETMTMDATGKWLGANCGNVKPMPSAR
jgi:hypothetical protein